LPVISVASFLSFISPAGKSPTLALSRKTVTRSAISITSSRRCETKTVETPDRLRSATRRMSASTSCRASDEVGSSMITSRASAAIARLIATNWRLAIERSSTRAKGSSEAPMRAIAASAVAWIARQFTTCGGRDGARPQCFRRR
jgi:hypothetical protein